MLPSIFRSRFPERLLRRTPKLSGERRVIGHIKKHDRYLSCDLAVKCLAKTKTRERVAGLSMAPRCPPPLNQKLLNATHTDKSNLNIRISQKVKYNIQFLPVA